MEDGLARIETATGPLMGRAIGSFKPGDKATLFVRPEKIHLADTPAALGEAGHIDLAGQIGHVDFEGSFANVFVKRAGGDIIIHVANDGSLPDLTEGTVVNVSFDPAQAVVLAAGEMARD